ncbi:ATP-binding protein [Desulfonauticus submarinus]
MILAIASGKGGTGKTTVAVNLAQTIEQDIFLLDCDVEEPNSHIFVQGNKIEEKDFSVPIPKVDEDLCQECGECAKICQFNAIVSFNTVPLIFPELCHSCGGCIKVCPTKALSEVEHTIGKISIYKNQHITLVEGKLNIGHPMAPPLIKAVKKHIPENKITILDAPPGTSCPVIATLKKADVVLLVTEPTPFGLNDLKLAVETVRELKIPFGVVINRAEPGRDLIENYCQEQGIPILLQIPDSRQIAEFYSKGKTVVESMPEFKKEFKTLLEQAMLLARRQ